MITVKEKIRLVESLFGEGVLSGNGKNLTVQCPKCKSSAKTERKRKLSVCIETGMYHCWVCEEVKGKNIGYLAKKVSNSTELYDKISEAFAYKPNNNIEEKAEEIVSLPKDFQLLYKNNSRNARMAISYLEKRGFTMRDMLKYKAGVSQDNQFINRVIFPSFDNQLRLNYYVTRTYDPSVKFKYKNCASNKKGIIFNENLIDWKSELVLVEGIFDAVKVDLNVACILGSWIDESHSIFQKIVEEQTPIILALDPDAIQKSQKIAKLFSSYCINVKILKNQDKDLGDMTRNEIKNCFKNLSTYDNTNRIRYLISEIKSGSMF